jgi:predicted anti-sigma-YlaC factor YlaD
VLIDGYQERLAAHRVYIREHDEDLPEVRAWRWSVAPDAPALESAEEPSGHAPHEPHNGRERGSSRRQRKSR